MRPLRTGNPVTEEFWDVPDVMNHLKCDKMKATELLDAVRALHNQSGYGPVRKDWVLDYISEKDRAQREREIRYQSDLANVESIAVLKEQAKTFKEQAKALKEQIEVLRESAASSGKDAQKARISSYIANTIAIASLIVAIISITLKIG